MLTQQSPHMLPQQSTRMLTQRENERVYLKRGQETI